MTLTTLVILAAATYRVTALLVEDWVPFGPTRTWWWRRHPYAADPTSPDPAGRGEAVDLGWWRRWKLRHLNLTVGIAGLWSQRAAERIRGWADNPHQVGVTRLGYLATCTSCTGVWVAAAFGALWWANPTAALTTAAIPAVAGIARIGHKIGT